MPSAQTSPNRGAVPRPHASRFQAISLLATDVRMAFIILNQARYRTLERVLGLSREEANIATLIVGLILADAARERALQLRTMFHPPAAGDVALGAAAVRESIYGVAGTSSWEMPLAGTLVTIAVAGGLAAPVLRRSARAIRGSSRALRHALDRQYGRVRRLGSAGQEAPAEPGGTSGAARAGQAPGTDGLPTGSTAQSHTDLARAQDDLPTPASRMDSV